MSGPDIRVLRYFLKRGGLAELRVPRNMTIEEIERFLGHIEAELHLSQSNAEGMEP